MLWASPCPGDRHTDRQKAVILWSAGGHRHAENETLRTVERHCHFFREMSTREASSTCFSVTDEQVSVKNRGENKEAQQRSVASIYTTGCMSDVTEATSSQRLPHLTVDLLIYLLTGKGTEDGSTALHYTV